METHRVRRGNMQVVLTFNALLYKKQISSLKTMRDGVDREECIFLFCYASMFLAHFLVLC